MSVKMLKDDGSVDSPCEIETSLSHGVKLVLPDLDSPSLYTKDEAQRRIQWILSHFDDTHKTESAFYLTFCRLKRNDIAYLKAFWQLERDFEVFKRICRMHKIRIA